MQEVGPSKAYLITTSQTANYDPRDKKFKMSYLLFRGDIAIWSVNVSGKKKKMLSTLGL